MLLSAPKPAHPPFPCLYAHPCTLLPILVHVSCCFCTVAQLVLYCTLEHSATAPAKADASAAILAATSHLAELVMSLTILTYPFAHGTPFSLVLHLTLRLIHSPCWTLTFSQSLLTLPCLTPLVDTPLFVFFDQFLAAHLQIIHLTLPNFVGICMSWTWSLRRDVNVHLSSLGLHWHESLTGYTGPIPNMQLIPECHRDCKYAWWLNECRMNASLTPSPEMLINLPAPQQVLHLLAMARATDIELTINDFQAVANHMPYLADLKPSGQYYMADLHCIGGIPALLKYLPMHTDLIDGTQLTMTGRTLVENIVDAPELLTSCSLHRS